MRRITKSKDAYPFTNKIVAFKAKSPYYGNYSKSNVLNNDTIFAKIESIESYCTDEFGCGMGLFLKKKSTPHPIALTSGMLEKHEEGFLEVRLATAEEIKQLKKLVAIDNIQLSSYNKDDTLHILDHYTPTESTLVECRKVKLSAFYRYDQKSGDLEEYNLSILGNKTDYINNSDN